MFRSFLILCFFLTILLSGCSGEIHSMQKLYREFNPPPPKYGNCKCFYYSSDSGSQVETKCKVVSSSNQCDSVCGLDEYEYGNHVCRR